MKRHNGSAPDGPISNRPAPELTRRPPRITEHEPRGRADDQADTGKEAPPGHAGNIGMILDRPPPISAPSILANWPGLSRAGPFLPMTTLRRPGLSGTEGGNPYAAPNAKDFTNRRHRHRGIAPSAASRPLAMTGRTWSLSRPLSHFRGRQAG